MHRYKPQLTAPGETAIPKPPGARMGAAAARQDGKGSAMEYMDLTEEQKAKAKAAKSPEELIALAKAEGVELSDEQLEAVSGGWSLTDCLSVCTDNQGGRECNLLAGHM